MDFWTVNREALERRPSCQLEGEHESLPWFLLCWVGLAAGAPVHLDLFVEVRTRLHDGETTTRVEGGCTTEFLTQPTEHLRPEDRELAATLDRVGFHVEIGKWGVRFTAREPAHLLRDHTSLETAFMAALQFAQAVARVQSPTARSS